MPCVLRLRCLPWNIVTLECVGAEHVARAGNRLRQESAMPTTLAHARQELAPAAREALSDPLRAVQTIFWHDAPLRCAVLLRYTVL
jgi:hypothetical protein